MGRDLSGITPGMHSPEAPMRILGLWRRLPEFAKEPGLCRFPVPHDGLG